MTDLNPMWDALARYQPYADKDGHGESWRKMCSERTEAAADVAWVGAVAVAEAAGAAAQAVAVAEAAGAAAQAADAADAADAAAWLAAAERAEEAARAAYWSDIAIERIETAIKERNND